MKVHKIHIKISQWMVFIFISFSLPSCLTLGTVEIEVIKPAEITLPSKINSILLVNNSLLYHNNSFKNDVQNGLYKLDTTTTQLLTRYVNDLLNQSPRYDTSKLISQIYFRKERDLLQPIQLNAVSTLCKNYGTDALLSLEAFGIIDTVIRIRSYDGYGYMSYPSLSLVVNSMWRLYSASDKKIIEKRIQRDTITLSEIETRYDYHESLTYDDFISYLADKIANTASFKVSDHLAPYWLPVNRNMLLYDSNDKMKQASIYAYSDKWMGAATIWKTMVDNPNKRIAAAACHNMALACEVEGKLDVAVDWLQEAQQNYHNYVTEDYLKQLNIRIKESTTLDKQFGVENTDK